MPETRRLKVWRIRLLMFLAVIGPGFITANVDNDAGGIYTYSAAGAQFGYLLLWVMIPMTVALVVVQEMSARMGAVTGKGLSDLIREEYGLRITFFMMLGLIITNFGNVVAEFAGIASSLELFHISRYISVPVAGVVVWLLVVKGTYKSVEKVFLAASFFYFAYIIAGVLAGPSWKEAFVATFKPPHSGAFHESAYIYMVIGVVGTTIAPWMQFYLQVVNRGEGNYSARVPGVALGRNPGMSVHRYRCLVHRGGLRGHTIRTRRPQDSRCRGRCAGLTPAGRRVCLHSVCSRIVQCVAVRRVHPAHLDRLHGLRRPGLRVGRGPQVQGCQGVLLAVHAAAYRRRQRHSSAQRSADQDQRFCRRW